MKRIATTVLAVVGAAGPDGPSLTEALGAAANVRAVVADAGLSTLDRAAAAWSEATRSHVPYLVHDADPLADVAAAWAAWWGPVTDHTDPPDEPPPSGGVGERGRLDVAVQAAVQRWRAGTVELPDYYLVVGPERLPVTQRHWYLGVLAGAAPHRVALVDGTASGTARAVRALRAGRWWPDLDRLLTGLDRRVPDAVQHDVGPAGLVV